MSQHREHTPIYTFLKPGEIMQPGDEFVEPWFTWSPVPAKSIGKPVTAKSAQRVRRPAPDLLLALEASERALTACAGWFLEYDKQGAITANHWAAEARAAIDKARGGK